MPKDEPLRLLFDTQSTGLKLFWSLFTSLKEQGELGKCGFFVTNRYEFSLFEKQNPFFHSSNLTNLAEWDILAAVQKLKKIDLAKISAWEREYADPTLWNALIVDRRMGFGLKAQFAQSYEPVYCHDTLLKILQCSIEATTAQFDAIRPHAVIGLNAVTLYDYLYYLIAKKHSVPYFQLKLTRIQNYVSLFTEPFSLSPHIVDTFHRLCAEGIKEPEDVQALQDARTFLSEAQGKTLVYEGAIKKPEEQNSVPTQRTHLFGKLKNWAIRLQATVNVREPHYPTIFYSLLKMRLLRPLRRKFFCYPFDIHNAQDYLGTNPGPFALYPLNTEPEVALLAFGRPYRNQIETVRNIAAALPVGWKLVVKEHPNAFGYRSVGYYRKLKQIPNVLLASHRADTGQLTQACSLLALVYGTIGLEAIIKKKPVILLCETPYGVFPNTMVRFSPDGWRLGQDIRDLLDSFQYDERKVEAYLAAHIKTGIRINLFTELLQKGGRTGGQSGLSLQKQYASLAIYLRCRIKEEQARLNEQLTK